MVCFVEFMYLKVYFLTFFVRFVWPFVLYVAANCVQNATIVLFSSTLWFSLHIDFPKFRFLLPFLKNCMNCSEKKSKFFFRLSTTRRALEIKSAVKKCLWNEQKFSFFLKYFYVFILCWCFFFISNAKKNTNMLKEMYAGNV